MEGQPQPSRVVALPVVPGPGPEPWLQKMCIANPGSFFDVEVTMAGHYKYQLIVPNNDGSCDIHIALVWPQPTASDYAAPTASDHAAIFGPQ